MSTYACGNEYVHERFSPNDYQFEELQCVEGKGKHLFYEEHLSLQAGFQKRDTYFKLVGAFRRLSECSCNFVCLYGRALVILQHTNSHGFGRESTHRYRVHRIKPADVYLYFSYCISESELYTYDKSATTLLIDTDETLKIKEAFTIRTPAQFPSYYYPDHRIMHLPEQCVNESLILNVLNKLMSIS